MSPDHEIIVRLFAWVIAVSILGACLAYYVHWLLVFQDYKDYLQSGGRMRLSGFRKIREAVKKDYRHQRSLEAMHCPHQQVAASLGEHVRHLE